MVCNQGKQTLQVRQEQGGKVFEKQMFKAVNKGETYGTPSIDTDGTVFIGCGSKDQGWSFYLPTMLTVL